jgi:hypothetical protein
MRNGRCRLHGGKSTGPRTIEGRERMRASKITSGRFTKAAIEQRRALRLLERNYRRAMQEMRQQLEGKV